MRKKKKSRTKGCGHFNLDECCIECAETLHEWNSKLQESGFFDIELEEGAKHYSLCDGDKVSESANIKLEYHLKLCEKTNEEKFANKTHEFILRKKSEGSKIVDIVKALDSRGESIYRGTVRYVIRRYENKWRIRNWNLKQMDLKDPTG